MSYFKQVQAIIWKDIISEARTKEIFSSMLVFTLLVLVIFNFAFEPGADYMAKIVPGILWVAYTFAGTLGLNRSMMQEQENFNLQGLMLCPLDRSAIFVAKLTGNMLFMMIVELISLPILGVLYNTAIWGVLGKLLLIMLLSTLGFASVGTLLAAMSVNTKTREVMLPILLFPVTIPVIIAAVKSTGQILAGAPWENFSTWLILLIGFDIIFLTVSLLVFEHAIEE